MKNPFVSFSFTALSLVTIACHKTDGVIPQEQFVGIYNVVGSQRTFSASGNLTANIGVSDQVIISSIPNSNRIKISSVNHPDLEAVLINKNSFKVPDQLISDKIASSSSKSYAGTGVVLSDQLILSIDATTYTNQSSTSTRMLTHVEGTRQ